MYYSNIDNHDIDYPIDNYNFKRKKSNNSFKREYPENMSNSDHITDKDDSYEDEEYAHS